VSVLSHFRDEDYLDLPNFRQLNVAFCFILVWYLSWIKHNNDSFISQKRRQNQLESIFTIPSEADVLLLVRMRGQTELVLFRSQSNAYQHYSLSPRNVLSAPIPLFCQQVQRSSFILLGNEWFSAQETTTSKYIL